MSPEERPLLEALQRIVSDERACNCVRVHSWYGEGHASECPIAIAKYALEGGKRGQRKMRRVAKKMLAED